jgi:hypothetical protein
VYRVCVFGPHDVVAANAESCWSVACLYSSGTTRSTEASVSKLQHLQRWLSAHSQHDTEKCTYHCELATGGGSDVLSSLAVDVPCAQQESSCKVNVGVMFVC